MRLFFFMTIMLIPGFQKTNAQFTLDFGKISNEDLTNKPYRLDPGADAVVLSDIGVATMNYRDGFYVRFERDVKIRIINSNGFDYADIEVTYSSDDDLLEYKASSFNLRNGQRIETPIPKKSFFRDDLSRYRKTLKFNFPDVHEGTIIEYSYVLEMKDESVASLIPWEFQRDIPVMKTSLTVSYPEFFLYKTNITGNARLVQSESSTKNLNFGGHHTTQRTNTWYAQDVPAFRQESYMKSARENQTRILFELARVNFPNYQEEITPTWETLTKKLLERSDFGLTLTKALSLRKIAEEITSGLNDDLSKVRAVHKYIAENILWDGTEDYTANLPLKTVYNKEKGSSADINMLLIAMLRHAGLKADPVILSTRSNGNINQISAMVRQFNYVVANVTINGETFLVDATDHLRPWNLLPFNCLNGSGRLVNTYESRFIELKNSEEINSSSVLDLSLSPGGDITGSFIIRKKGYKALEVRNQVRNEGEDGYLEIMKSYYPDSELKNFSLRNLAIPDSDIVELSDIRIENSILQAGNKFIINPYLCFGMTKNHFISPERMFPVDFGCPIVENHSVTLRIPDQFEILEKPENTSFKLGNSDALYNFSCIEEDNKLVINSTLRIIKTSFSTNEYAALRDFYTKMLQSQARVAVLKKKI